MLTRRPRPTTLTFLQFLGQVCTISVQYAMTTFHQGYLQVRRLEDLDECRFQPWDLHPILDTTYKADRVDLCADVL